MSKYTEVAHEVRREQIQVLRSIMMESPKLIKAETTAAKAIGRIFSHMPMKKKDFAPINADVAYLLQDRITALVSEELKENWVATCETLKG